MANFNKILSVVVPTYNMEALLDRCLSSMVLDGESMSRLEVLVVNDGSKDGSSAIAHRYAEKYPDTFTVIDKENGNYGSCVNKGLELARGKYFRILDADDWFNTASLCEFLKVLSGTDADLVFTKYSVHWSAENVAVSEFPSGIEAGRVYSLEELSASQITQPLVRMHGMTYRTELLREVGLHLQHGVSYTDTEYCYYPCKAARTMLFVDLQLYCYDNSREGQTMSPKVLARSAGQMYKVACPLLKDYLATPAGSRNPFLDVTLKNILYMFYRVSLCLCPRTKELAAMLREMDGLLVGAPEMDAMLQGGRMRRIDYMKLWRKFGLFSTQGLFGVYNRVFDKLKQYAK